MTTTRLRYTTDELLTDPPYVARIERDGVLLHGGYDADGRYLPPRSTFRVPAIAAWTDQLAAAGHPSRVIEPDAVDRAFVPNTGLLDIDEFAYATTTTSGHISPLDEPAARLAAANCPEHAIRLDP